jgi:nucleoside phosphorylase
MTSISPYTSRLAKSSRPFRGLLGTGFEQRELPNIVITCYFGKVPAPSRAFRLMIIPAGKMGNTRSADVVSAILTEFSPKNVAVIGIAGSLASDLQPGDVLIPEPVNEYLANSAGTGVKSWTFQTSGNHFSTNPRLLNRCMVRWAEQAPKALWLQQSRKRFRRILGKQALTALNSLGLHVRAQPEVRVADDRVVASGLAVGKGTAFVKWLNTEVDRKAAAIDMESAGVYDACSIRTPAPRTIAIRGISDFADERKEILETQAKGGFRRLAAMNATAYFVEAIRTGVFDDDQAPSKENLIVRRGSSRDSHPTRSALAITPFSEWGMSSVELEPHKYDANGLFRVRAKFHLVTGTDAVKLIGFRGAYLTDFGCRCFVANFEYRLAQQSEPLNTGDDDFRLVNSLELAANSEYQMECSWQLRPPLQELEPADCDAVDLQIDLIIRMAGI